MASNILLQKIEGFIKKYYTNQLIKGSILAVSLMLIAFFVLSFAEYYGRFNIATRTTLFYLYVTACVGVLFWYILRPILGLVNINRKFGVQEASKAIGRHFPDINDKLLNTLQLQEEAKEQSSSLLLASIEQRTSALKPIPFTNAINFSTNSRYVKVALLPALLLLVVMIISPGFKSSSDRLVHFDEHYEIQAPFEFITSLGNIKAIQNQDVLVPLEIKGDEVPNDAYIHIGEHRFKMKSDELGKYQFTIKNIQESNEVYFEAGGFTSEKYNISLALKPSILGYEAYLSYPKYLGKAGERLSNLGEISVPQGTVIKWRFTIKNVDELVLNNKEILDMRKSSPEFKRRFMKTTSMKVATKNKQVDKGDSIRYQINVIPDQYPGIMVNKKNDSLSSKVLHFLGEIDDDYGFSKLDFNYRFIKTKNASNKGKSGSLAVGIDKGILKQKFYHYWNLNALGLEAEDEIEYYFTIWDNDGVNGAKATKSSPFIYKAPSLKEIKKQTEEANKEIKSSLSGSQAKSTEMQKEIKNIEKMLTEKKRLDWNDKKKIEELLKKQAEMQSQMEETIRKNLEKNMKEEEFKQVDESIMEKQKQLEKLMEEVMDDETKKMMEKIQKLLEENRMDKLQKEMENFEFSEKEMEKKMDRMLELFKELELEKKMNETIDKLEELAKEQKDLAKETANKEKSKDELKAEQDKLNKEFDEVKKDLEDIKKKNDELESPKGLSDKSKKADEISEKQESGSSKLSKGNKKGAAQDQQDAGDKMQKMADDMWSELQEEQMEDQAEDLANLRQILENLVTLSHDQEEVMEGFKKNQSYNPRYIELRQKQRKIKDETKLVEDSLLALSKRNLQIQHFVNEEIARVNDNLDKSLEYLGERRTRNSLVNQQYAMTGYNNLALMLSEAMKQMQEQMKQSQQNKGKPKSQCKKPGSKKGQKPGKKNMGAIKKMQQQMAKQLEQLQKGMQSGGGQPGSKEFAQMAAEQAAIRKKLQDIQRQLDKEGKGGSLGNLKETQDLMDDVEKDLYFKKLDPETMAKIKRLEIKLSQHEKAQKEQEQDRKRTSQEGKEKPRPIPPSIKNYLEQKEKETELLKTVSPELQPYFQKKVKEYFGN